MDLPDGLLQNWYWRKGSLYIVQQIIVGWALDKSSKSWVLHPDDILLFLGYKGLTNSWEIGLDNFKQESINFFFLHKDKLVVSAFNSFEDAGYSISFLNSKTGKAVPWLDPSTPSIL